MLPAVFIFLGLSNLESTKRFTLDCNERVDTFLLQYFIEPATGQRFRSVPEVQRYLASQKNSSNCKALTLRNHSTVSNPINWFLNYVFFSPMFPLLISSLQAPRSPVPRKKNTSLKMFKTSIIDLTNPPEKINWIFSGDGRDNWSPLVEECLLPDYVKEQWEETFLLGMNGWKHRVPQVLPFSSQHSYALDLWLAHQNITTLAMATYL